MLRSRSNCIVMLVDPVVDRDVIKVMPGMVAKARSSGAATEAAIVSGLLPGNFALTLIVG